MIHFTHTLNRERDAGGVRGCALPGFVDTPMAEWSGIPGDEMMRPRTSRSCECCLTELARPRPGGRGRTRR